MTKGRTHQKRKTIVLPGRFQPFHQGHFYILKKLLHRYPVIIAIGSSDLKNANNPFTAQERKKMIQSCFPHRKLRFVFIPYAPDRTWIKALLKKISRRKFDFVFTNNPRVKKQLRKAGILYQSSPIIRRHQFHGQKIRQWHHNWSKTVPKAVAQWITKNTSIPTRTINRPTKRSYDPNNTKKST